MQQLTLPTEQRFDWWLSLAQSVQVKQGTPVVSAVESAEILAAVNGDSDAYRRIINRHQPTIARQISRFSRESLVVEELVHDVFVEAFLSLPRFKGDAPLEHWLRRIAVRVGYKYWKTQAKQRRQTAEILQSDELRRRLVEMPSEPVEANDLLYDVLARLSDRDRLVLTLIYWDDCSTAEAARLTGWTQSLVKVQAYRARNRMKKLMEELDNETK